MRRAGFAFFGVFNGTEVNPEFESEVASIIESGSFEKGKQTPIVVICHTGGSLDPSVNMKNGKQSRFCPLHASLSIRVSKQAACLVVATPLSPKSRYQLLFFVE